MVKSKGERKILKISEFLIHHNFEIRKVSCVLRFSSLLRTKLVVLNANEALDFTKFLK